MKTLPEGQVLIVKALTAHAARADARQPLRGAQSRAHPSQGVTIDEVADRARVSITTVSRVLRGRGPVVARTRERLLAAIDELSFTPSRPGRALAERRHAAYGSRRRRRPQRAENTYTAGRSAEHLVVVIPVLAAFVALQRHLGQGHRDDRDQATVHK